MTTDYKGRSTSTLWPNFLIVPCCGQMDTYAVRWRESKLSRAMLKHVLKTIATNISDAGNYI